MRVASSAHKTVEHDTIYATDAAGTPETHLRPDLPVTHIAIRRITVSVWYTTPMRGARKRDVISVETVAVLSLEAAAELVSQVAIDLADLAVHSTRSPFAEVAARLEGTEQQVIDRTEQLRSDR
jgi:hypothetical protein